MKKNSTIPVLYEDDTLLAINKPAGKVSVPDPNNPIEQSVMGLVQAQFQEKGIKPYLLHRLDSQTSGVLLFGKYNKNRTEMEAILTTPTTSKKYVALLKGIPQGKEITAPLQSRQTKELIPAKTLFHVLRHFDLFGVPCSIVEAEIKSGRRHQIRQHFAQIGCPVVMDPVYGDVKFNRRFRIEFHFSRLFLHSRSIRFIHPITKKDLMIVAPFPPDMMSFSKKVFGRGKELF